MTSPALARPPSLFSTVNVRIIAAGTILHRTHSRSLRPAEFNPCLGQPSRFAPFTDAQGACVPTLYAATTREAAAFETIFHDIEPSAAFKTVRRSLIEARSVSRIATRRILRLAGLFSPDLKAWGLARADLIDTPKSADGETVLWARALHASFADLDGLTWTSRHCDPECCLVLFGDRVAEHDLGAIERREVVSDPALLLELRGYGRRAGIAVVS